ncbi:MAG: hypothetical protein V3U76_12420 [Granulosicoccus sp.]
MNTVFNNISTRHWFRLTKLAKASIVLMSVAWTGSAHTLEFKCDAPGDERFLRVELPGFTHLCEVTVTNQLGERRVLWYADHDSLYCSAKAYELRDKYEEQLKFDCVNWPDRDGIDRLSARHRGILDTQLQSLNMRGASAGKPYGVAAVKAVASTQVNERPGTLALQFFLAPLKTLAATPPNTKAVTTPVTADNNVKNTSQTTEPRLLASDRDLTLVFNDTGKSWKLLVSIPQLASRIQTDSDITVKKAFINKINEAGDLDVFTIVRTPGSNISEATSCYGQQVLHTHANGAITARTPHRFLCPQRNNQTNRSDAG